MNLSPLYNVTEAISLGHLYFVRHGETFWNVENKICGQTDSPLTKRGHAQAIATGERIRSLGLQIDQVLSSPLSRAYETAQHIAEINGFPLQVEPRLIEQNFGKYEGTPRDGKEFAADKQNFICSYGGGETMLHLAHRIYSQLDDITADEEHTYLLVAHNGISRVVYSYFHDMTNEEYADYGIPNADILELTF